MLWACMMMLSLVPSCVLLSISALKTVSSAPASTPAQPALFMPHDANTSSFLDPSAFWRHAPNATDTLGEIETFTIDRAALGRTILAAQLRVRTHLKTHGDGDLWEEDDPFETPLHLSGRCFIGIASPSITPGASDLKLSYSTLGTILQGLWDFMYVGKRECEVVFKVEDKARERRREGEELAALGKVLRG
ncbi:hypothetical protein G7Y79_00012g031880 [Physcia stellaris]|nr:hypothetical protein G7Y79_00012g031880 [Physcia stellaris]